MRRCWMCVDVARRVELALLSRWSTGCRILDPRTTDWAIKRRWKETSNITENHHFFKLAFLIASYPLALTTVFILFTSQQKHVVHQMVTVVGDITYI